MNYLNLNRRYVERETYDQGELVAAQVLGKLVGWDKVLESRCCVVVAPANFGKTTELQHRAHQMRSDGHTAVFVALRQLADRGSLDKALKGDDRAAFRAWKAAPVGALTVFVDSLDEAAAGRQESIGQLVEDVAEELSWPNERVRWVISTRPAVLTGSVFQRLSELLTKTVPKKREPWKKAISVAGSGNASVTTETIEAPTLRLFSMAPLEKDQAIAYLTGRHPKLESSALVDIASERGLAGFVRSPGGLDILARIDLVSTPPASLTDVFERVVNAIQILRGADRRLVDAGSPAPDCLSDAAQRLAAASQICQLVNIEMPEATLEIPEKALSARLITSALLTEAAIRQLLTSQLFIDSGFNQVKVYPEELLPFLAARQLSSLVESFDQAERLLENFTWTSPSGEQGVQRAYLPLMGWLATLNAHCREIILEKDPQALAFFGDLRNPAVPIAAACEALTRSIERLVEQGDQPGRGMFTLTSENFWQAGPERLAPTLSSLYDKYKNHFWARDVITDIATVCKLGHLREEVLQRHGSDYGRLLSNDGDVGYLLALGHTLDLKALATAALASTTVGEASVDRLLRALSWDYFSPTDVARLVDNQYSVGLGRFHLSYSLVSGGILSSATEAQLYELARGLVVRLVRPNVGPPGRHNREKQQYVDLVAEVLEALVSRTETANASRVARLCLVFQRFVHAEHLPSSETSDLARALSKSLAVRRALLKLTTQRQLDDHNMLMAVVGYARATDYCAEDIEASGHPNLRRVYAEWQTQVASSALSQTSAKVQKPLVAKLRITARAKKELASLLPSLADGTATRALEWVAAWLLQTNPSSRYGEVHFEAFEQAAGAQIADAVRRGLGRIWRDRAPQFNESAPNSTFHISVAGLQGLQLELAQGLQLPSLTDDEVRRALRYGILEINGYPKWFWPLVSAYPAVAVSELAEIAQGAASGPVSKEHAEELLASLPDAPTPVCEALAHYAWGYLKKAVLSRDYLVSRLLKAALSVPEKVPQREFERIALMKMRAAYRSPLPSMVDESLRVQRAEAVTWASRWLISHPLRFRNSVNSWGSSDALAVKAFLFDLAAHLGSDNEGVASQIAKASDEGVAALEDLYLWTMWAVNPANDLKRPEGTPFILEARDHAQHFRGALIGGIAAATSQAAYDALSRIRKTLPPDDSTAEYIKRIQFDLRERQFTREPLPQRKYDQFERDFRGDVTGSMSFSMAVHADLRAVRYDIERGEHSLRSFFSEVDFKRINRNGDEGERAGLALEANFQRLLASELHHCAHGRYTVAVESQTAEAKRRDVLCSRDQWRASIELKMSERWTLPDYLVALEMQLVGQYMRNNDANTGFLVVVLQTKQRRWTDPTSGKKVDFPKLVRILSAKALELEAQDRSRYLRVIGVDATSPDDFRKKTTAKSARSKKGARPRPEALRRHAG